MAAVLELIERPSYILEDISDPEDRPPDPPAIPFSERLHLGRASPSRVCTAANPEIRERVLSPPSQGEVPWVMPSAAPCLSAPILHIDDPYYWPSDEAWEFVPPPASSRYLTPVSVITATVSRPRSYLPPLVPPPGVPAVSREGTGRSSWVPEGAVANASAMRGRPPLIEAVVEALATAYKSCRNVVHPRISQETGGGGRSYHFIHVDDGQTDRCHLRMYGGNGMAVGYSSFAVGDSGTARFIDGACFE